MDRLKIDFVSDISCPWCAIGLHALETALERLKGTVEADLHFQPFELNPLMAAGGQDIDEHLKEKYGASQEQSARNRAAIAQRGLDVGFTFAMDKRSRIYNTFDAHRLLHWAGLKGRQRELKHALFSAHFTEGRDPGDHALLADLAAQAGLDREAALAVLASSDYAYDVRHAEQYYQQQGISGVPAVIINDKHLITGGQPPEVFEEALRQVAEMERA
ncbi:MAG TPA: DsbA family oxidoreductase [Burkholderiaceae bacterium]